MFPRTAFLAAITVWLVPFLPAGAVPAEDGLYATFDTTCGEFTVKLEFEKVPATVANFIGLAEGTRPWLDFQTGSVSNGRFYEGLEIPRVDTGILFQAGSPFNTRVGGPGYQIPDEFHPTLTHSGAGIISMANGNSPTNAQQSSDTAGSQFFVMLVPAPGFDRKHAVFGSAVEGIGVVNTIGSKAANEVTINSITITRNGTAAQAFDPTAWSLPVLRPDRAPADLEIHPGPHRLLFPREGFTRYNIIRSFDLFSWEDQGFVPAVLPTPSAAVDISGITAGEPKQFFSVFPADHTPIPTDLNGKTLELTVYAKNPTDLSDIPPKTIELVFSSGPRTMIDYTNPLGTAIVNFIPPGIPGNGVIGGYFWNVELRRGKLGIAFNNFAANFPGYSSDIIYLNLSFRAGGTGTFTGDTVANFTGPFLLYGTFTISDSP